MVLPPSQTLWAATLVLTLVEMPGVVQKCIFDEVQAQTRVVRAAPAKPTVPSEASTQTGQGEKSRDRRATLHPGKQLVETPASAQPIRIHSWKTEESSNLLQLEGQRLQAAAREAFSVVSSLLSVNRVSGPLLLRRDINRYCKFLWRNSSTANYNRCGRANPKYQSETCLDVTIPDDHLAGCQIYPEADSPRSVELRPDGAGVPLADFLLYLHVKTTLKCKVSPSVLAYATHCQTDERGRPLAGVVVVCRDRLSAAAYSHQSTVQIVIHELFHVLGFSKHLFHAWSACSSNTTHFETAQCSSRGKVTHSDATGQTGIYTPSVIWALQRHLDSSEPELGGPLEDQDVPRGRASSHWESRSLQGSIMTASLGDPATVRVDAVTLAAMQDTGWYRVNLTRAQSLVWGKGEGSTFGSLSSCLNKSSPFFCTGSGSGCHYLHLHKGECQTDQYLDGCRLYGVLENGSECWKEDNAHMLAAQNWRGEVFGLDSRCFFANLTRQFPLVKSAVEGRCYRHKCTGPNSYQVQVWGSGWVDCPAGGNTEIDGYQGLVFCPDKRLCVYADIKPPSDDCNECSTSIPRDVNGTLTTPPAAATVSCGVVVVGGLAVCLLAVVAASNRKCFSFGVRIHLAPQQ